MLLSSARLFHSSVSLHVCPYDLQPFYIRGCVHVFTFIEDVYVVPHKFIEFVKINIRQNRTYYASLRCSDIGIFVLPLFHVACFEEFTYQSQETLVIDSFSKDSD